MQKLTTRQALAGMLAIWDAWRGPAPGDEKLQIESMLSVTRWIADLDLVDGDDKLTDAGRAMLADAPRTAEQERADVVAYLRRRVSADAGFSFGVPDLAGTWATDIASGVHVGISEARDDR